MSASAQLKSEEQGKPENIILGSAPLRYNLSHERYAQARALGFGIIEAGRRAGWSPDSGAASKAEKSERVQDRIAFLADLNPDKIKRQRVEMERLLGLKAMASMADFVSINEVGYPVLDLKWLNDIDECRRREILGCVKSVSYTENGPKFELFSPLDAIAQLRRMNGLDQPQKHDVDVDQQVNVRLVRYGDEEG